MGEENGNWYYSFFVTEKNIGELLEELRSPNAVPQGTTPYTVQDKPLRKLLQENFQD
ncbi:hypothetical protein FACS189485_22730 [Spirochaetia bacterium]|nr:hypothetical protein FACS189485_22730 [Spirochaetia bacterium]